MVKLRKSWVFSVFMLSVLGLVFTSGVGLTANEFSFPVEYMTCPTVGSDQSFDFGFKNTYPYKIKVMWTTFCNTPNGSVNYGMPYANFSGSMSSTDSCLEQAGGWLCATLQPYESKDLSYSFKGDVGLGYCRIYTRILVNNTFTPTSYFITHNCEIISSSSSSSSSTIEYEQILPQPPKPVDYKDDIKTLSWLGLIASGLTLLGVGKPLGLSVM